MNFIEPITDPEIVKLGIRWALYREPCPKRESFFNKSGQYYFEYQEKYDDELNRHEQSFIVYLKEPGWKVGDDIYWVDKDGKLQSGKVKEFREGYIILEDGRGIGNEDNISYSHYYPGQEYDGDIKYVRKKVTHFALGTSSKAEWQEVEEPANPDNLPSIPPLSQESIDDGWTKWKTLTPNYTQFKEMA